MTATPGSATPTASEPRLVARFGVTERTLHWIHAAAFFALLGSGLVLYLPSLAERVGSRPVVKAVHLAVAVSWLGLLVLVTLLGDRRALRRSRRELERFDDDDLRWLRGGGRAPQGRFNAGQKVHAVVQAALAVLLTVSGVFLWLGERDTGLRLDGSILLHDVATYVAVVLVAGHLVLALAWPRTRPALRGMVQGGVREDWAREHHAKWTPAPEDRAGPPVGRGARGAALGVLAVTVLAVVLVVHDTVAGAG
jgi:formate dehydrogenase subunit gamma